MRTATVALLGLLFLPACAGIEAREHALMPAMELALPGLAADAQPAIEALDPTEADAARATIDGIRAALETRDRSRLVGLDWSGIRSLVLSGIQSRLSAGDIGPGVAASKLERLRLFDEAWVTVTSR